MEALKVARPCSLVWVACVKTNLGLGRELSRSRAKELRVSEVRAVKGLKLSMLLVGDSYDG